MKEIIEKIKIKDCSDCKHFNLVSDWNREETVCYGESYYCKHPSISFLSSTKDGAIKNPYEIASFCPLNNYDKESNNDKE